MVAVPQLAPRAFPDRALRAGVDRVAHLMNDGAYGAALSVLSPVLESGMADPVALDQAATCFWHLDQGDGAMALMQQLVDDWPALGTPCVKLASFAASCGQRDRALDALGLAFDRGVRSAQALALLNRLQPMARDSSGARRLKVLARSDKLPRLDRAIAQNTLGRIEDRAGRSPAAFRWYTTAKRTQGGAFGPDQIAARVIAQEQRFDPSRLAQGAECGPRFLFITGMPRSGTTVLDHALARHSRIRPMGESVALSRTAMALRRQVARAGPWDWFDHVTPADRAAFRQLFLSYLPLDARDDPRLLMTKMPLDCLDLGVAAWLWPNARFVHLARHPMDVGLSNITTLFHQGHGYSRRLDWTAHMIRAVDRSVTDYQAKLGRALRQQSYRALVRDPQAQLRAILTHAGLDWEGECLSPQSGTRPVQTASIGQVEAGFNTAGLDKWHRFKVQLAPLAQVLGSDWLGTWEAADTARAQSGRLT